MNECWDEGGLRAYIDRELPAAELPRVAAHIGGCAECHARYNELAGRAARVASMMTALETPVQIAIAPVAFRRRWVQPVAAAALALAAAAVLAFVLMPKRAAQPEPVAAPRIERVNRPVQAEAPAPRPSTIAAAAPARITRAKSPRQAKPAETDYYLALDDEPIDMGVVMRVALGGSDAAQADVVFDAEGRARAIRPVKLSSK